MKKRYFLYLLILPVLIASARIFAPSSSPSMNLRSFAVERDFSFIKYDQNYISPAPVSSKWDMLFSKFEQLAFEGEGNISVVHIGGSHVQGGFLTDRMRENFIQLVHGAAGERGFVFPYDLAKTNGPKSIQCSWTGRWTGCRNSLSSDNCSWGVSGINATCEDQSAGIQLKAVRYDSIPYTFTTARIYHQNSDNVQLEPDSALSILRIEVDPVRGFTEYTFAEPLNELRFSYHSTDSLPCWFSFQGAYLASEADGLTYNAIGVNGASTRSYLRCENFGEQLETLHPDLAIFGIGVNDANVPENDFDPALYEARYDSLISQFLKVNPQTCILFVTNNDTYYQKKYPNKNAIKVQETMYRLAKKYDGAVYDLFSIMGGLGSIRKWQEAQLAAGDKIHLSKRGYELQADLMTQAFREAFGNYLDRKYKH